MVVHLSGDQEYVLAHAQENRVHNLDSWGEEETEPEDPLAGDLRIPNVTSSSEEN